MDDTFSTTLSAADQDILLIAWQSATYRIGVGTLGKPSYEELRVPVLIRLGYLQVVSDTRDGHGGVLATVITQKGIDAIEKLPIPVPDLGIVSLTKAQRMYIRQAKDGWLYCPEVLKPEQQVLVDCQILMVIPTMNIFGKGPNFKAVCEWLYPNR